MVSFQFVCMVHWFQTISLFFCKFYKFYISHDTSTAFGFFEFLCIQEYLWQDLGHPHPPPPQYWFFYSPNSVLPSSKLNISVLPACLTLLFFASQTNNLSSFSRLSYTFLTLLVSFANTNFIVYLLNFQTPSCFLLVWLGFGEILFKQPLSYLSIQYSLKSNFRSLFC